MHDYQGLKLHLLFEFEMQGAKEPKLYLHCDLLMVEPLTIKEALLNHIECDRALQQLSEL